MGVMHIPLLIIPLVALLMPVLEQRTKSKVGGIPYKGQAVCQSW
jgi:hypothetical protein